MLFQPVQCNGIILSRAQMHARMVTTNGQTDQVLVRWWVAFHTHRASSFESQHVLWRADGEWRMLAGDNAHKCFNGSVASLMRRSGSPLALASPRFMSRSFITGRVGRVRGGCLNAVLRLRWKRRRKTRECESGFVFEMWVCEFVCFLCVCAFIGK